MSTASAALLSETWKECPLSEAITYTFILHIRSSTSSADSCSVLKCQLLKNHERIEWRFQFQMDSRREGSKKLICTANNPTINPHDRIIDIDSVLLILRHVRSRHRRLVESASKQYGCTLARAAFVSSTRSREERSSWTRKDNDNYCYICNDAMSCD